MKDSISGLRNSGSKRINLSQVRVFRKNYRDQREFVAQHNSNIGTRRAQLRNISLGGFRLIELSYDYPLIRLICHAYKNAWGLATQVNRDQRESVAKAQLKHRRPLSTAQKYCLGDLYSKRQEFFMTLIIGLKARLGSQVYPPKTPGYPAFLSKPLRPGNPGMTRRTFDKSILCRP